MKIVIKIVINIINHDLFYLYVKWPRSLLEFYLYVIKESTNIKYINKIKNIKNLKKKYMHRLWIVKKIKMYKNNKNF